MNKLSSTQRLNLVTLSAKRADFRTALHGAEKALNKVQDVRQKSMQDFTKQLQKQNDDLRKEVTNASQAADSAADAARKVQVSSDNAQAQALQMATPGVTPPAAQPPFGAMALSPGAEGTAGQEQKPNQALGMSSATLAAPPSI